MIEQEVWEFKKNDVILDIRLENPVPYLVLDSEYHSMYMLLPYMERMTWNGGMAWDKEEVEGNFVLLDEQEGDDEEG